MADSPARYHFEIPVGDWSGDGHDHCDRYTASAAKPVEACREAFFAAQQKLPEGMHPDKFCRKYGDSKIPPPVLEILLAITPALKDEDLEDAHMDSEWMAQYVTWFLNQGDPELDAQMSPLDERPSLVFFGRDKQGRHIGHLGYGLFA